MAGTASDVPYSEREEWKDVQPLEQDDGPVPVVPIAYSEKYVDAMNYLRAVLAADELSERALALTTDVIALNSAHYTTWWFRRRCLRALGGDLRAELRYVDGVAHASPKNYQVWYHRRAVVEMLGDPALELPFVRAMLTEDAKNYHAWAHRQWVLGAFAGLWEGELDYVESLLLEDVRNNSAWNHRWFTVSRTGGFTAEVRAREVAFVKSALRLVLGNDAAWNYLRGLMRGQALAELEACGALALLADLDATEAGARCVGLQSLLADVATARGDVADARSRYELLRDKLDDTRARYWAWRLAALAGISGGSGAGAAVGEGAAGTDAGAGAAASAR